MIRLYQCKKLVVVALTMEDFGGFVVAAVINYANPTIGEFVKVDRFEVSLLGEQNRFVFVTLKPQDSVFEADDEGVRFEVQFHIRVEFIGFVQSTVDVAFELAKRFFTKIEARESIEWLYHMARIISKERERMQWVVLPIHKLPL